MTLPVSLCRICYTEISPRSTYCPACAKERQKQQAMEYHRVSTYVPDAYARYQVIGGSADFLGARFSGGDIAMTCKEGNWDEGMQFQCDKGVYRVVGKQGYKQRLVMEVK